MLAIICAIILTYKRHHDAYEERRNGGDHKKDKWMRRQSSRYSIDLDRFVADIMGTDVEQQQQNKSDSVASNPEIKVVIDFPQQQLKQPQQQALNKTNLNPLAVSIINLVAKSLQ